MKTLLKILMPLVLIVAAAACGDGENSAFDASPGDADVDAAVDTSLRYVDLGMVTANTVVSFEVPPNALGFQLVVEQDVGGPAGILSVVDPYGEILVADHHADGAVFPNLRVGAGVASAIIPQSSHESALQPAEGTWTVTLSGAGALSAGLYIRESLDGEYHGGSLDLTIYIPSGLQIADPTPVHTVSAATAADDEAINARLDSFFDSLQELFGIGRGTVHFVDIGAEFLTIDYANLGVALGQTTGAGPSGAHFILVNGLTFQGGGLWGTSSGVPGASTTTGHATSGVVVDISQSFGAVADGKTMLHELGHFAGLFHTSDQQGFHDTLEDTPECVNPTFGCPDANNIMFYAFWGGSGGGNLVASDHQRRVMQASPLYSASPSRSARTSPLRVPPPNSPKPQANVQAVLPHEASLRSGLCGHALVGTSGLHRPTHVLPFQ